MEVAFTASDSVQAALALIGRTEDAAFSPNGKRFAIAGFVRQRILIIDIDIDLDTTPARVALTSSWEIESDSLVGPHGLFWADEGTLIVANRGGLLSVLELPSEPMPSSLVKLDPVRTLGVDRGDFVMTPGSVSALAVAPGILEVLVCNNYVHHVSRHLLDRGAGYAPLAQDLLVSEGLAVPDGIAHSPSGRWFAVSNHETQTVHLYRNDGRVNCTSMPDGVLRGVIYPHGLRFSPDGRSILVADAGAPYVRIFSAEDGDWRGERVVTENVQVLGFEVFERGHYNIGEGGPKGIDITRDGSLMIVTCQEQALAIFDLRETAGMTRSSPEVACLRDALLRYVPVPENGALAGRLRRRARIRRQKMRILIKRCYARIKVPLKRARDEFRKVRGVSR